MMKEHSFSWIAGVLGIEAPGPGVVRGMEIDSRKVGPGQLFFALKGKQVDGHNFLRAVAATGAAAALVSKTYQGESFGLPLFRVDDVVQALQLLAKRETEERGAPIVAVTGSVGKTTTKEFLAHLLQNKFRLMKTPGNSNSQVTTPLCILNAPSDVKMFVLEMGMTAAGEIANLVQMAPPLLSLITRVGAAHIGGFLEGIEGIAKAKAEIFSHPKTEFGLYNAANHQFKILKQTGKCKKHSFAYEEICKEPADFVLKKSGEQFYIVEKNVKTSLFSLPFHATHLCEDFIAAASGARLLGIGWEEIFALAQTLAPYKSRFERIERGGAIFINDAYNANPVSMRAAFANLPPRNKGGRRIAVLAAMADLGAESERYHREIGEEASKLFDHLLCLSEECLPMIDIFTNAGLPAEHFSSVDEMRARLFALVGAEDVVLIKGKNSHNLWKILE
ncbi:MAG: UDP-N-acetylmuramoyl-tripeptide--D-alanyl-D-alanine ligase [Chlamydiales bacterium]